MKDVQLPNKLTSIGKCSFYNCDGFTQIAIPRSVTSIGDYAFSQCSNLMGLYILENDNLTASDSMLTNTNSNLTLYYVPDDYSTIFTEPTWNGKNSEEYVTPISEFTIDGDQGERIGTYTGNRPVVVIPTRYAVDGGGYKLITEIKYTTFSENSDLEHVIIPDRINAIGGRAFYGCYSLKSVEISYGIEEIGTSAFERCSKLRSIRLPDTVTVLGERAFRSAGLHEVVIPGSITNIERDTFQTTSLKRVVIQEGVEHVKQGAFERCGGLKSVELPSTLKTIGSRAFLMNSSLEGQIIPYGVTSIGDEAFRDCDQLDIVLIPDTVNFIGNWTFSRCMGLKEVYLFENDDLSGDEDAFSNSRSIEHIYYVPCEENSIFGTNIWSEHNPLEYDTGLTFNNNTVTGYSGDGGYVSIPEKYYENTGVTSVTKIAAEAFRDQALITGVTMGDSITEIGRSAFYNCENLREVHLSDHLLSIGMYGFGRTAIADIKLPESLKTIDTLAFFMCSSLGEIGIPKSVTSIGGGAFESCANLEKVYFKGDLPEIVDYNGLQFPFEGCSDDLTLYCYDQYENAFDGSAGLGKYNPEAYSGDLNGDGLVDIEDVVLVLLNLNISPLDVEWKDAYDVAGDGSSTVIDMRDVVYIKGLYADSQ